MVHATWKPVRFIVQRMSQRRSCQRLTAVNKGEPPSPWTKKVSTWGKPNELSWTCMSDMFSIKCSRFRKYFTFLMSRIFLPVRPMWHETVSCCLLAHIMKLEMLKKAHNVMRWCHWNGLQPAMTSHSSMNSNSVGTNYSFQGDNILLRYTAIVCKTQKQSSHL